MKGYSSIPNNFMVTKTRQRYSNV